MAKTQTPGNGTNPVQLLDTDSLLRRVRVSECKADPATGITRPGSADFTESSDGSGMSCLVERLCGGAAEVLAQAATAGDFSVVRLSVGELRRRGLTVTHDGVGHPAHANVQGLTRGIRVWLAHEHAQFVDVPQPRKM